MSRSNYTDDCEMEFGELGRWRGQVASAIRGKRGQAFLRELIDALDALPEKRLIAGELCLGAELCAIGSVGARRGLDLETLDPENYDRLARVFGIASQLVREIEWMNDDAGPYQETPELRWTRMRAWAISSLKAA